jgi:hypothetical protein
MAHCQYCAAGNEPDKNGWHCLEVIQGYPAHEVWCRARLASSPKPKAPTIGAMTDAELVELYDACSEEITRRDIRENREAPPQEQLGYTTLDPMENAN